MGTESLVWYLILLAVFGLIVGAVGRLLVPGPSPLGLLGTMAAGLAGAFLAGIVARLLLGPDIGQVLGWVLSILGAAVVVALVSGYGRTSYRRPRGGLLAGRAHDDRVVVDDPGYRPVRRHRFF